MKVISSKVGSTRERVDAEVDLVNAANWRIAWKDAGGGMVRSAGRFLVLPSRWGTERSTELWLTELEAIAIAKAVTDSLLDSATDAICNPRKAPAPAPEPAALSSQQGSKT